VRAQVWRLGRRRHDCSPYRAAVRYEPAGRPTSSLSPPVRLVLGATGKSCPSEPYGCLT
jgi:hypothetical protein